MSKLINESDQNREAELASISETICNTCKHASRADKDKRYINCAVHKCSFSVLSWCTNWND